MTTPLATASTNVYTVDFDGFTIYVRAKQRGKLLRTIPLAELVAVDFRPARSIAGGQLRFVVAGKASTRDRILFQGSQQPGIEALAAAIQRVHRPPVQLPSDGVPHDPWASHPVEPNQPRQPVVVASPFTPRTNRMMYRLATLGVWMEGIQVFLMLIPVALGLVCCVAYIFSR